MQDTYRAHEVDVLDQHEAEQLEMENQIAHSDPRDLLKYTQAVRRRMVNKMTGEGIPTDPKEASILLQTLRDMDTTVINTERNQIDKESLSQAQQAKDLITELHKQMNPKDFIRDIPAEVEVTAIEIDETELDELTLVPGVTSTELSDLTYERFVKENPM